MGYPERTSASIKKSDCLSPQGTLHKAGGDPSPGFGEVGQEQGRCQDRYFWNMIGRRKVTSARREVNYTLVSGFLESCPTNTKQTQGKVTSVVGIVVRGYSGPSGANSLCPDTRPLPLAGPERVPDPTEPAVGWEHQSPPPWRVAVPSGLKDVGSSRVIRGLSRFVAGRSTPSPAPVCILHNSQEPFKDEDQPCGSFAGSLSVGGSWAPPRYEVQSPE